MKAAGRQPMAADVVSLLIADKRCGNEIERRRGDCVRLAACETAWSQRHGVAQAQCPARCDGYASEGLREALSYGANGLVSMSGG